jgi:hypothetical protein
MFSISEFKSQLTNTGGILNPNKFSLVVSMPTSLQGQGALLSNPNLQKYASVLNQGASVRFFAEEVDLPGIGLQTEDIRRYGYGIVTKQPHNAVFSEISMTVRCDANGIIWKFFHAWMQCAVNTQAINGLGQPDPSGKMPYEVGYRADYASTSTIQVYNTDGSVSPVAVGLRESFPLFVADTPLRWGSKNEYLKFHVNMSFLDWYPTTPF